MKIFAFCLLLCCLLGREAFGQFYYPDKKQYHTPDQYGLEYESITFQSKDTTKLHAWFVPASGKARGTVVHFHGNGQNMTAHFSFVHWLPSEGFNLFVFDYRGYGESEGTPSRKGIHEDALAALDYIKTRTDIDHEKLLVLGQSLGGAVAISAIGSTNISGICGIAVESTFESYTEIAKDKAPDILASLLISDALSPKHVVANISPTPLLIIHGTADNIVPYTRGKRLYAYAKKPKAFWTIQGGRHTEAFTRYKAIYRPRLVSFFMKCIEHKAKRAEQNPAGQ